MEIDTKQYEVTPQELCRKLGISKITLIRWRKLGCPCRESKAYRIGRSSSRPRYVLKEVLAWLDKMNGKEVE